jgi:hypothetical protein
MPQAQLLQEASSAQSHQKSTLFLSNIIASEIELVAGHSLTIFAYIFAYTMYFLPSVTDA